MYTVKAGTACVVSKNGKRQAFVTTHDSVFGAAELVRFPFGKYETCIFRTASGWTMIVPSASVEVERVIVSAIFCLLWQVAEADRDRCRVENGVGFNRTDQGLHDVLEKGIFTYAASHWLPLADRVVFYQRQLPGDVEGVNMARTLLGYKPLDLILERPGSIQPDQPRA